MLIIKEQNFQTTPELGDSTNILCALSDINKYTYTEEIEISLQLD